MGVLILARGFGMLITYNHFKYTPESWIVTAELDVFKVSMRHRHAPIDREELVERVNQVKDLLLEERRKYNDN